MKNEKLESLARGLSAWKKYRKAMLEMQKQQMDSTRTTDEPSRVSIVDSNRRLRGKQMSDVQLYKDWSKK